MELKFDNRNNIRIIFFSSYVYINTMGQHSDLFQIAAIALLVFAIMTAYYHREKLMSPMRHVSLKDSIYGVAQPIEKYQCDRYNSETAFPADWLG
jgi:hypothetical protein